MTTMTILSPGSSDTWNFDDHDGCSVLFCLVLTLMHLIWIFPS